VKVGHRFSTQDTLEGANTAAWCAAGPEHAKEADRAGFGTVYRSAHAAVDPSVAVDVFAADLTENRPDFYPACNLDSEDRCSGIYLRNLAVG
jgi:hypothetical protein